MFNYLSLNISGYVNAHLSNIYYYLSLKTQNDKLKQENIFLRSQLDNSFLINKFKNIQSSDTILRDNDAIYIRRYNYTEATTIDNIYKSEGQVIQLFKGLKDGVKVGQGVISSTGIIGVIYKVSDNYSLAYTLYNTNTKVSCQIKNTNITGILKFTKQQELILENISNIYFENNNIKIGDTILTSQYSHIFPRFLFVGLIEKIESVEGSNFLKIMVKPMLDFGFIQNTYIVIKIQNRDITI